MKEKDMRTNVILPESLWERAKIQATMERVSFTEIVRRALLAYLRKSDMKATAQSKGKGKK
jgi:hypothetical protein